MYINSALAQQKVPPAYYKFVTSLVKTRQYIHSQVHHSPFRGFDQIGIHIWLFKNVQYSHIPRTVLKR